MQKQHLLIGLALTAAVTTLTPALSSAGEKPFPNVVSALTGAPPEGFAMGRAFTAYNGSVDGSIYKMNLKTGEGEVLVPAEPGFDLFTECYKLGMRVDRRSNLLFVAGCQVGNAYVIDADSGEEVMQYQLTPEFAGVINDVAITRDAVYFTDSFQPQLYRLPLGPGGALPDNADAAEVIPLGDVFLNTDPFCCAGNGIVATPDGHTLIVGHSNRAELYKVDAATGESVEIDVEPPLNGFLDGIVMKGNVLYIMTPAFGPSMPEMIQVVVLADDLLSGERLGFITDPALEGVASGGIFGDSIYVNNARYSVFPQPDTAYSIVRLNIYDVE